jgi:hypothetical protein
MASTGKKGKNTQHNKNQTAAPSTPIVPVAPICRCGSQRVFEFQLLPSMLHVLEVDSAAGEIDESMDLHSIGGMSWGSIAVYSCPNSCDESREEVCIVQCGDEAAVNKMEGSCGEIDHNEDGSMED